MTSYLISYDNLLKSMNLTKLIHVGYSHFPNEKGESLFGSVYNNLIIFDDHEIFEKDVKLRQGVIFENELYQNQILVENGLLYLTPVSFVIHKYNLFGCKISDLEEFVKSDASNLQYFIYGNKRTSLIKIIMIMNFLKKKYRIPRPIFLMIVLKIHENRFTQTFKCYECFRLSIKNKCIFCGKCYKCGKLFHEIIYAESYKKNHVCESCANF